MLSILFLNENAFTYLANLLFRINEAHNISLCGGLLDLHFPAYVSGNMEILRKVYLAKMLQAASPFTLPMFNTLGALCQNYEKPLIAFPVHKPGKLRLKANDSGYGNSSRSSVLRIIHSGISL